MQYRYLALCIACCAISGLIYLGVMLGIWMNYLETDWHSSQCVVTNIRVNKFTHGGSSFHYSTFTVKVLVDDLWMTGFACGTPSPRSYYMGSSALNTSYPYTYGTCAFTSVCGNEVIQPIWYCSDCRICDQFLTGKQARCKWTVIDTSDSVASADEWPLSADIEMPRKGSSYIQVVLGSDIYFPKGEFITLQIFGVIGLILVPCFLCLGFIFTNI